ncbi:MAG: GNAT family N-acetyltransferase, partial [Anaerolineae bacterium]|nr:GNAT family N-acetyltransferase [Anaerolineae bacterium]
MKVVPASAFSLDFLADLYTRTFAGYFYAAVITADDMARFVHVEDLDLDHSPVLCVGEEPVALATVCLRGERANCRGFGVTVPYRGRRLAHALCQAMLDYARQAGARTVRLGVLVQNEGAVRTYRQAGFRVTRRLLTWEWEPQRPSPQPSPSGRGGSKTRQGAIQACEPGSLLDHFDRLHPVAPIWPRELPSLRRLDTLRGLALVADDRLMAYALVEPDAGNGGSIGDLAAETTDGAVTVLEALQARYRRLVCSNEPADSPVLGAFEAAGFALTHQRYEMLKDL